MREIDVDLDHLRDAVGGEVFGPGGDLVGTLGGVYLDDESGGPEWIEVRTGPLKRRLVPLDHAQVAGQRVDVGYERRLVERSPRVSGRRDGTVAATDEQRLFEYYAIPGEHTAHPIRLATSPQAR